MAATRPVVLPAHSPSDMLNYALRHPASTILICYTRSAFLESLTSSTRENPQSELLHATLHQIVTSRTIKLAFLPTLSHLRAYLAVFDPKSETSPESQSNLRSNSRRPLVLVYGILNLHRDTSEWSAQGLGATMASLVDSGSRHGHGIVICEEDVAEVFGTSEDVNLEGSEERNDLQGDQEREERRRTRHWREEMPMLNGSTRRMVADGSDEEWASRTVEVGRVLQRWCVFKADE